MRKVPTPRATPNASQVRGLVYAVKDNRVPPTSNRSSTDSIHRPAGSGRSDERDQYVTAMLANRIDKLTRFFKAEDPTRSRSSRSRPRRSQRR
jgi:hypothetical protein